MKESFRKIAAAVAFTSIFYLPACDNSATPRPKSSTVVAPANSPQQLVDLTYFPLVCKPAKSPTDNQSSKDISYATGALEYPQLKDLKLKKAIKYNVDGTSVRIYDFTDGEFSPTVYSRSFEYFKKLTLEFSVNLPLFKNFGINDLYTFTAVPSNCENQITLVYPTNSGLQL